MKALKKLMLVLSTAIIASSTLTTTVSAYSSTNITDDENTFIIDGYEVYQRDGSFYTMADGKETGFFLLSESTRVTDADLIMELDQENADSIGTYSLFSTSTTDLSSGGSYTESSVNVTSNDYTSPDLKTRFPSTGTKTLRITPTFNHSYGTNTFYIKTTIYLKVLGTWYSNTWVTGYNALISFHDYIGDTASRTATNAKIKFWANSDTTPEKEFGYTVCQCNYAS